jgi:hypothetical protein
VAFIKDVIPVIPPSSSLMMLAIWALIFEEENVASKKALEKRQ